MRETVISWTVPNMVTIALMMLLAGVAIGVGAKVFAQVTGGNNG